jgi:hypothetical protein
MCIVLTPIAIILLKILSIQESDRKGSFGVDVGIAGQMVFGARVEVIIRLKAGSGDDIRTTL